MFGLMHQNACGLQEEAREHYRLHHCGACKAIGKQYQQSARLFLNFDFVFLAELLSALSNEDSNTWHESYHSYNCFAPGGDSGEQIPFPLRYAASTIVLLAALKTDDNLKDAPGLFWRLTNRWFRADFEKAEAEMAQFGVDMDEVWHWIECQQKRENEKNLSMSGEEALRYYAEPTARITAAVFSRGALLAGASEELMRDFGFRFGELVYVLDALEDVETDRRKRQFNALQQVYQTVDETVKQLAANHLFSLSRQLQDIIQQFPISISQKEEYKERLSANIAVRVANALEEKRPHFENWKRNLAAQTAMRVQNASSFAKQLTEQKPKWVAAPQYAISFLAVFVVPETAREIPASSGQGIAFAAVFAGLFAALFSRRKIRRAFRIFKRELKRRRKPRKGKPKNKKRMSTWDLVCLVGTIIGTITGVLCVLLACRNGSCEDCCEDCCQGCCEDCCERPDLTC